MPTDYQRDKQWERSEWWRVPTMPPVVVALVFLVPNIIACWR